MEQQKPDNAGAGSGSGSGSIRTYCVTGATGYIGSWLVKSLLEKGHSVQATLRNPANCDNLLTLWRGGDRLRLFKADLYEEGSFDEALQGCHGVFHVAASMELTVPPINDLDNYVKSNIIDPSIKGTLNILKSCLKSKSVKRVVFTSSISTMTAQDDQGKWRPIVDESCQTSINVVWNRKASGWVYALSKRLTEEGAFKSANENNINLVSIITTTVAGPFLTSTVPLSIRVLLSPVTGDPELLSVLSSVNSRMGSIALVHIEDICNAHVYLMEHDQAEGRYICCIDSCTLPELIHHLAKIHPFPNLQRVLETEIRPIPTEISSKKLKDLGFRYNHGLHEVIHQTVDHCIDHGFVQVLKQEVQHDSEGTR